MTIIADASCDGTNGVSVSQANSSFVVFNPSGAVPVFDTTTKWVGSASLDCSATGLSRYCLWWDGDDPMVPGSVRHRLGARCYYRIGGAPSAQAVIGEFANNSTICAQVQVGTDRKWSLYDGSTQVWQSTAAISVDTWCRWDWWFNNLTGQQRAALFAGDGSTPVEDTGVMPYTQGVGARSSAWGVLSNVTLSGVRIDAVRLMDSADFPGVAGAVIVVFTDVDFSMLLSESHSVAATRMAGSGTATYAWTVSGPDSSTSQFANASAQSTLFTPTLPGVYTLTCTGTDATGADSDTTTVTVTGGDRMVFSRTVMQGG